MTMNFLQKAKNILVKILKEIFIRKKKCCE